MLEGVMPQKLITSKRQYFAHTIKPFVLQEGVLYIDLDKTTSFVKFYNQNKYPQYCKNYMEELQEGNFSNVNVRKILDVSYWLPMMNGNVHKYYQTCDQCQRTCNLLMQNLVKLVTTLPKEPFQKWGLIFFGHVKPISN
jgi:hypothetical protein